jgi:hypothetical protein
VRRISSHQTKIEQNIKSNQHRIDKLEKNGDTTEIKERLIKIETDILWIRKSLEERNI